MRRHTEVSRACDGESLAQPARTAALLIGGGRVALGVAFALDPRRSVQFLGVDAASATRLTWLAQMTAARDAALGAGTVVSTLRGRGSAGWLLAGAVCDAADAVIVATAVSRQQVKPIPAAGVVIVAVSATVAAAATAFVNGRAIRRSRRRPID